MVHGVDSTRIRAFCEVWDTRLRSNTVQHQNIVFHDLLKWIPWAEFDRLVAKHNADHRVRRLPSKSHFIAMLYGQFSGATSLRAIEAGLDSHSRRLYHIGGRKVQRSTLGDANANRPSALFSELFAMMVGKASRRLRKQVGEAVYLIDATSMRLSGRGSEWARFSAETCGVKAHVIYDADAEQPIYSSVSAANVNDITAAQAMPIEAGATYVFDLGYYDYTWWAKMDAAGCRIVTRFKHNTPLEEIEVRAMPDDTNIVSDRVGYLPRRQAKSRKNPMNKPVREVTVKTDTGKKLRILSNDLDASAEEIAALYKRRWAIELFFRCVKQTLKIKHFIGKSENAVGIQIAVALIAFLLLRLAHDAQKTIKQPLTFVRLVSENLMYRRRIDQLTGPRKLPPTNENQLALEWPCS